MDQLKARAANLRQEDRSIIVELVLRHQSVIENKKTDAVTNKQKESAWKLIEEEYNAVSAVKRNFSQLKQAYENIKKKSKKVAASDKMERFKTGGGYFNPQVDTVDEKVLLLLGNRATPLVNQFDSDCFYQCEIPSNTGVEESGSPTLVFDAQLPHDGTANSNVMILTIEDDQAPVQNHAPELLPTSSTKTEDTSKQWAKKRRRPTSLVHLRNDAASKISDVADCQQAYYQTKLNMAIEMHATQIEMAREKHALELSVLSMQQQLLIKQLAKFTEE